MRKNLLLFMMVVGIVALLVVVLTTETAQKIGQEEMQVAILVQEEIQIAKSEENLSATIEKGIMFATNPVIEMPSAAPGDNLVAVDLEYLLAWIGRAAPGDNLIVSSMEQSLTRLLFAKQEIASAAEKNSVKRYATV